ncbi:DUF4097 family beta strand repeat-containing protein [Lentzea flaviverrucosa]|uniref:Adhesin n=1 Tax=Lentzea flaviverrucosa TaxID=200379 RepID=A0A1H9SEE4_9PSEU|nr:hypothetical protein [Lentzea flaviverrucosa]RDI25341.1 hypothetical protein DFR72_10833 [Lentzea flaviverrucosa]SER83410.1 hypothetical protein SAMN05216195_10734 [Lentzea flaviverrucosa]
MTAFPTPEPIFLSIQLPAGEVHVVAGPVVETTVVVEPVDAGNAADVAAVERTKVEHTPGKVVVRAPGSAKGRRGRTDGAVAVRVTLPEDSHVRAGSAWANFRAEGRLGVCRLDTVTSAIQLDRTGMLQVLAVRAELTVGRVIGQVKVATRSGSLWFDEIDGSAVIKNDNGECTIGTVTGPLRLVGANGEFTVDSAGAEVRSKTAYGAVRIGELLGGTAMLASASGEVEIGIPEGTAARLDVSTVRGIIYNGLTEVDRPSGGDRTVDVHAHTFDGDIIIRRTRPR